MNKKLLTTCVFFFAKHLPLPPIKKFCVLYRSPSVTLPIRIETNMIEVMLAFVSQVPLEDLHWASQQLMEALHIRERYMRVSHQSFPTITSRFFHKKPPNTQDSSTGNASVLRSSDSASDVTAAGGDPSHKAEIRQPYPRARVIKHEDRQSIAGKSRKSFSANNGNSDDFIICLLLLLLFFYSFQ